jgi:hypothetical protein
MGYQLIETVTVGSGGAASIEFTGIPQDGVDLVYFASLRCSSTAVLARHYFNSDTSANYSWVWLRGDGSAVATSGSGGASLYGLSGWQNGSTSTANTFSNFSVYVPNYTSSVAKSYSVDSVDENNATASYQNITAGKWNSTAAVTGISVLVNTGNLVEFSSVSLYKVTAD